MNPPHPVIQKLRQLKFVEQRWLAVFSFSIFLSIVFAATCLVCVADFYIRSESTLFRLFQSGLLLTLVISGSVKFLAPLFKYRRSMIDVAKAIEVQHPEIGTQLSLAADFLGSNRNNGSEDLRQAVINRAESQLTQLSLPALIRKEWPIRATILLTIVLVICVSCFAINPSDSSFALTRTVSPFKHSPWPAFNNLAFEDLPEKIAVGDDLLCKVIDRKGRLPRNTMLEIDDGNSIRRREMSRDQQRALFQISNASHSLRLRAVGGDDKTDWHRVEVVRPPEIKSLNLKVTPPDYSRLKSYGAVPFHKVWEGSSIVIHGTSTQPVTAAQLVFTSDSNGPSSLFSPGLPFPGKPANGLRAAEKRELAKLTSATGLQFPAQGKLNVKYSATFKIELTSQDQIVGGRNRSFQIPVRKDEPPFVEALIENSRSLYAISDVLEIQVKASDDMQLKSVHTLISLDGKLIQKKQIELPQSSPQAATSSNRAEFTKTILLDLNSIEQVAPNSVIQIQFEVRDVKDQATRSNALEARIGTDLDLNRLDAQDRKKIYDVISQALQFQRSAQNINGLLQEKHRNQNLNSEANALFKNLADQQDQVESALFGAGGASELLDRYLSSNFELADAQSQVKREETARAAAFIRSIKDVVRATSLQANEAAAFADDFDLAIQFASKAEPQQARIADILQEICGAIDEQTRYQSCLAELRTLLGREHLLRQEAITLQTESLNDNASKRVSIESERLSNEQKGITAKLNEIGWGLLQDAKSLDSRPLKRLSDRIALIEIESKSIAERLSRRQFGLAIQSIDKLIESLIAELNAKSSSFSDSRAATPAELQGAQDKLGEIVKSQGLLQQGLQNWKNLSDEEKRQLKQSLSKMRKQLAEFANQNRSLLSRNSSMLLDDVDRLLEEIDQQLQREQVEGATEKMNEVNQKLSMIGAELQNKSRQAERLARNERFKKLQIDFANWRDQQSKIQTTLMETNQVALAAILQELLPLQTDLTRKITACKKANTDLFALQIELDRLQQNSQAVESAIQAGDKNSILQSIAAVLQQLNRLCDESVEPNPAKQPPDNPRNDPTNNSESSTDEIQISEFEVQLIRIMQEEILSETKEIEARLNDQNLRPQERAQLKTRTLSLADRQAELISTLQKYLTPQTQKKSDIPDIPQIPETEIPQIPEIELECGDFTTSPLTPFQDKQDDSPQPKTANQKQGKQDNIESVAPFAKEGEDLGEGSNSARNRLAKIREKMESVQQLLIQQKLSQENQDVQDEIIKELKLFLTDKQKQSKESSQKQNQRKNSKQGDNAATNSETEQNSDPAGNDGNNNENREIQKRIDEIWGHLPEKIRRKELNIRSEYFLPKYRDLIKDYFKRLANEPAIQ